MRKIDFLLNLNLNPKQQYLLDYSTRNLLNAEDEDVPRLSFTKAKKSVFAGSGFMPRVKTLDLRQSILMIAKNENHMKTALSKSLSNPGKTDKELLNEIGISRDEEENKVEENSGLDEIVEDDFEFSGSD